MGVHDPAPSSYFPPFLSNRPPNPIVPVQNAPYTPALKLQRTIDYVQGFDGAAAFDLAPNSSALALDQNENIIWVIATDQNGSKSMVKGFYLGEEYIPPKPVTMEDLMNELRDMKSRVINLEEDRANEQHNRQPAFQGKPDGANASTGNRNSAGAPNGKPASDNGPKQPANEAST